MSDRKPIYIGEVLKSLRKSKQMSQEEFAYQSSFDRKSISLLEGNHQEPSLSTPYSLAAALGMDALDFMKEIDDYIEKDGYMKKKSE